MWKRAGLAVSGVTVAFTSHLMNDTIQYTKAATHSSTPATLKMSTIRFIQVLSFRYFVMFRTCPTVMTVEVSPFSVIICRYFEPAPRYRDASAHSVSPRTTVC